MLSYEVLQFFKNTFNTVHLQANASVLYTFVYL